MTEGDIIWSSGAWDDYQWQKRCDRRSFGKVKTLIQEILIAVDPYQGTGKPEPLRYDLAGWYSRRVNKKDRLVYRVKDNKLYILQTRFHYGDPR